MNKLYKTQGNMQKAWDELDKAYEHMENAIEMLSKMNGLPEELTKELDQFDIGRISSLKQNVEMLMDQHE